MRRLLLLPFALALVITVAASSQAGQWEKLNFPHRNVYTLQNTSLGLFAATPLELYLSTDNGSSWDSLTSLVPRPGELLQVGDVLLSASSYLRLAVDGLEPLPCVYRSTDHGHTWDSAFAAKYGTPTIARSGSTLYINPDARLYASPDTGRTWARTDRDGLFPDGISKVIAAGNVLYVIVQDRRLYRSVDGGKTWDSLATGSIPSFSYVLARDSSLYVGTTGFFLSHNQGITWRAVTVGLSDSVEVGPLLLTGDYIIAGAVRSLPQTVYRLHLPEGIWQRFDAGLTLSRSALIWDFADNDSFVFLAADGAVWRRPLSDLLTSALEPAGEMPATFKLEQNYPNPFNPTTTIRYSLPHSSHVTLTVFNTLAQKVADLVDGEIERGDHEVQFDARGLASGVYFYRLRAGSFVRSKAMMVVK